MAEILKIYTAEQLYEMYRQLILSKNAGITDFNEGSKIRALLESNSEIVSSISMDFKNGLMKALPIAFYNGFGFAQKAETKAIGYIRPYRKPALWIKYTGSGSSALINSTAAIMTAGVVGAPGAAFSFDYASYPTLEDLVTAIDGETNWEATLVGGATVATSGLYQYTNKEAIGATNYLNTDGLDIMLATATEVEIIEGYSVTIDNLIILSTAAGTVEAGESGVQIPVEVQTAGFIGNLSAGAIDTEAGKGSIASVLDGIEHVINDSAFSGGAPAETAAERQVRFAETVNSLNAGTKSGIISAIKGITGVRSAGMRTSYPFKGTNTIVVDDGSSTISTELRAAVEKVLYGDPDDLTNYPGKNAEGIGYTIVAPTIVDVNVGITAFRLANVSVDPLTIRDDVTNAVEQYINTRPLGEDVILSEIVRVGKNANAAVYDLVITSPAANVVIQETEFAKTGAGTGGTVTVTVTII
jgi:uncharacterized phage protein gp47/JayE